MNKKKICVILSIVALYICYASQGVQVAAQKGDEAYQQDADYPELSDNSFYRTHKEECKSDGSSYLAKEEVTCYKNPESDAISSTIEKGSTIYIIYTYQKAFDTWGLASAGIDRWVKLRDLEFLENVDSFIAEYGKEMGKPKEADLKKTLETVSDTLRKDIVKWSYPCSGKIVGTCSKKEYPDMRSINVPTIYQDGQGRYWMTYGAGSFILGESGKDKSYAICLSDPENDQIGKEITLTKPYTGGKYGRWLILIPVGIGAGILFAAFMILRVRKRLHGNGTADEASK